MRILVTGATGFIGAHVVHDLIRHEHSVAILARSGANCWRIRDVLSLVTHVAGDLLDLHAARPLIARFAPDTIIHLAWFGVASRHRNDPRQVTDNLNGTAALLDIAAAVGVKRWVGLGSQEEYGVCDGPIDEQTPPRPATLYGATKLCAAMLTRQVCAGAGMGSAWLRLFAPYGPMDNSERLVPYVILSFLEGRSPALTSGEQRWDYLYAADAATAIRLVAESPTVDGVFNLASGEIHTIRAIIEQIRDLIDPALPLRFGEIPHRPDQSRYLQPDVGPLTTAIRWSRSVTLPDGLERTVAWYRQHRGAMTG